MNHIKKLKRIRLYLFIGIMLIVTLACQQFILTNELVVGPSMKPNYLPEKHVIVSKISIVRRKSVIVFKAPDKTDEHYIKRVIGLPGDQVEMVSDQLYINNHSVVEPYLKRSYHQWQLRRTDNVSFTKDFGPITLKKDEYYVLGDNRPVSNDSRSFGPVKSSAIKGVVKCQY